MTPVLPATVLSRSTLGNASGKLRRVCGVCHAATCCRLASKHLTPPRALTYKAAPLVRARGARACLLEFSNTFHHTHSVSHAGVHATRLAFAPLPRIMRPAALAPRATEFAGSLVLRRRRRPSLTAYTAAGRPFASHASRKRSRSMRATSCPSARRAATTPSTPAALAPAARHRATLATTAPTLFFSSARSAVGGVTTMAKRGSGCSSSRGYSPAPGKKPGASPRMMYSTSTVRCASASLRCPVNSTCQLFHTFARA